jgi:hypothetical protein
MAHRRRQETLHFTWVTASTGRPRKRGKGTHDDQAYGSEQTSFLEPGSWPHKKYRHRNHITRAKATIGLLHALL